MIASGLTSSDYSLTYASGSLTVTKAALTVTTAPSTMVYGSGYPLFAAAYAGFVLSDDESVLGGSLSFATVAAYAIENIAVPALSTA